MNLTVSIKLDTTTEQADALLRLQKEFARACNLISSIALENNCFNKEKLHHKSYYPIRAISKLGSQLVCNSIKAVYNCYQSKKAKRKESKPSLIQFKQTASVQLDKNTYTFKPHKIISLYTLEGRREVPMLLGEYQEELLKQGTPKEARLVYKGKEKGWFFNLVLYITDLPPITYENNERDHKVLGVDLGENVLAATSTGKVVKGGKLRHDRHCYAAKRSRLQCNGSKSSKRRLKQASGKEARRIKQENHIISKAIVQEAIDFQCLTIALEDLTHIRKRMRGNKQMNFRLHGWAFNQLQRFIEYKAKAKGIQVVYVNAAYTSQICAECCSKGIRNKHRFQCKICGIRRHSDCNASLNIRKIIVSADAITADVNPPNAATASKRLNASPVL